MFISIYYEDEIFLFFILSIFIPCFLYGKCEFDVKWDRHVVENPHFFDVMHLPGIDKYVRLHLGEKEYDTTKSLADVWDDRVLYLTLFDSDFTVIGETELPSRRYSYFTGWGGMSDAVYLFVDNMLDTNEATEEIVLDIVRMR